MGKKLKRLRRQRLRASTMDALVPSPVQEPTPEPIPEPIPAPDAELHPAPPAPAKPAHAEEPAAPDIGRHQGSKKVAAKNGTIDKK